MRFARAAGAACATGEACVAERPAKASSSVEPSAIRPRPSADAPSICRRVHAKRSKGSEFIAASSQHHGGIAGEEGRADERERRELRARLVRGHECLGGRRVGLEAPALAREEVPERGEFDATRRAGRYAAQRELEALIRRRSFARDEERELPR